MVIVVEILVQKNEKIDFPPDSLFIECLHPIHKEKLNKIKLTDKTKITVLYPWYVIDGHHRLAKIIQNKISITKIEYKLTYIDDNEWEKINNNFAIPLNIIYKKIANDNNWSMDEDYNTHIIETNNTKIYIDNLHVVEKPIEIEKEYESIYLTGDVDQSTGWADVYIFKFKPDIKNKKIDILYVEYQGKFYSSCGSPLEYSHKEKSKVNENKLIELSSISSIDDQKEYFSKTIILNNYDYNNIEFEIDDISWGYIL